MVLWVLSGLFSFKNFQLMSITVSLYRPVEFRLCLTLMYQLNVDLKAAGMLCGECLKTNARMAFAMIHTVDLVPSALHFGVDGTRRVPTTLHTY